MRRCRTTEERREDPRLSRILIADNSNHTVCTENSRNPRRRLALIDGFHTEIASKVLQSFIYQTVSLPADDCTDRNPARRN